MIYLEFEKDVDLNQELKQKYYLPDVDLKTNAPLIVSLQASGYELMAIKDQFKNLLIPVAFTEPVVWFGDTAKFIAANLR